MIKCHLNTHFSMFDKIKANGSSESKISFLNIHAVNKDLKVRFNWLCSQNTTDSTSLQLRRILIHIYEGKMVSFQKIS